MHVGFAFTPDVQGVATVNIPPMATRLKCVCVCVMMMYTPQANKQSMGREHEAITEVERNQKDNSAGQSNKEQHMDTQAERHSRRKPYNRHTGVPGGIPRHA